MFGLATLMVVSLLILSSPSGIRGDSSSSESSSEYGEYRDAMFSAQCNPDDDWFKFRQSLQLQWVGDWCTPMYLSVRNANGTVSNLATSYWCSENTPSFEVEYQGQPGCAFDVIRYAPTDLVSQVYWPPGTSMATMNNETEYVVRGRVRQYILPIDTSLFEGSDPEDWEDQTEGPIVRRDNPTSAHEVVFEETEPGSELGALLFGLTRQLLDSKVQVYEAFLEVQGFGVVRVYGERISDDSVQFEVEGQVFTIVARTYHASLHGQNPGDPTGPLTATSIDIYEGRQLPGGVGFSQPVMEAARAVYNGPNRDTEFPWTEYDPINKPGFLARIHEVPSTMVRRRRINQEGERWRAEHYGIVTLDAHITRVVSENYAISHDQLLAQARDAHQARLPASAPLSR